jgi:hypothetical protein
MVLYSVSYYKYDIVDLLGIEPKLYVPKTYVLTIILQINKKTYLKFTVGIEPTTL